MCLHEADPHTIVQSCNSMPLPTTPGSPLLPRLVQIPVGFTGEVYHVGCLSIVDVNGLLAGGSRITDRKASLLFRGASSVRNKLHRVRRRQWWTTTGPLPFTTRTITIQYLCSSLSLLGA